MELHLIVNVEPEEEVSRMPRSDAVLDVLEAEMERLFPEIDGKVFGVTVRGSGKTAKEAKKSAEQRRWLKRK